MTDDEVAEQAYRLQKDYDGRRAKDLQMAMEDGVADKADAGALQAQAQEALDRNLKKLLGDQRFSELKGSTDPTAEVYQTFGAPESHARPGRARLRPGRGGLRAPHRRPTAPTEWKPG